MPSLSGDRCVEFATKNKIKKLYNSLSNYAYDLSLSDLLSHVRKYYTGGDVDITSIKCDINSRLNFSIAAMEKVGYTFCLSRIKKNYPAMRTYVDVYSSTNPKEHAICDYNAIAVAFEYATTIYILKNWHNIKEVTPLTKWIIENIEAAYTVFSTITMSRSYVGATYNDTEDADVDEDGYDTTPKPFDDIINGILRYYDEHKVGADYLKKSSLSHIPYELYKLHKLIYTSFINRDAIEFKRIITTI